MKIKITVALLLSMSSATFAIGYHCAAVRAGVAINGFRTHVAAMSIARPIDKTSLGIYTPLEEIPVKWSLKYQTRGIK